MHTGCLLSMQSRLLTSEEKTPNLQFLQQQIIVQLSAPRVLPSNKGIWGWGGVSGSFWVTSWLWDHSKAA